MIDRLLPEDLQPIFNDFVRRLRNSPILPRLGTLFQMFDQPYQLLALVQNAILAEADATLVAEFAEFVHLIYVLWAPDEY